MIFNFHSILFVCRQTIDHGFVYDEDMICIGGLDRLWEGYMVTLYSLRQFSPRELAFKIELGLRSISLLGTRAELIPILISDVEPPY